MIIYSLLNSASFEPDDVANMTGALADALAHLKLASDDPVTEKVALHIIEIAKSGETDRARILHRLLRDFSIPPNY